MKKLLIFLFFQFCSFYGFSQKKAVADSVILQNKTAWLLSSNFTIPTVQFLPYSVEAKKTKEGLGSVSFFNSVGAGLSLSKADFTLMSGKTDTSGIDVKNHIGLQVGFIFSRSAGQTNEINRFAFYSGISVLDFQIGLGKEFGGLSRDFKNIFYSISYAIPLSKFSKKTTLVLKNQDGGKQKKLSAVKKAFTI